MKKAKVMLRLHNTLSRNVEKFVPIHGGQASLYTCGPTVYDYAHVGNLRAFIFDDTLRRVLELQGLSVKHVMNITDVGHLVSDDDEGEDKLEKGAQREGNDVWDVANRYIEAFESDSEQLNILRPNGYKNNQYARATDFINQQIDLVKILVEKEFAYKTEQAVYFDISKLNGYGKLNPQKTDDKAVGVRDEVVTDSNKRNPHDFGLWFFTVGRFSNHTMRWASPWGEGFPGWHLECSAIIHATLGEPIDIHTGGIDHIGTHHPNEMAQTEAAYGVELANVWMHNEFVLIDGGKMSKSKSNTYTLRDIKNKDFEPLAFRLLCLQAHYRTELNFSWANLEAAQNRLIKLRAVATLRWQAIDSDGWLGESLNTDIIKNAFNDDLNTPLALASISGLAAQLEEKLVSAADLPAFEEYLKLLDTALGLKLFDEPDINSDQKQLLQQRETARAAKDYDATDKLRAQLASQGINVRDTTHGQIWWRETGL